MEIDLPLYNDIELLFSVLALGISALGFAVSALTLHYTFFRRRAALTAILLGCGFEKEGPHDSSLEYALCNTGNVQLVLRQVQPMISTRKELPGGGLLHSESTGAPAVIEPGRVQTVHVMFSVEQARWAEPNGQRCFVLFELLSSRGRFYQAVHDFTDTLQPAPVPGKPSAVNFLVWKDVKPFGMRRIKPGKDRLIDLIKFHARRLYGKLRS